MLRERLRRDLILTLMLLVSNFAYKIMQKTLEMAETLEHGHSSESAFDKSSLSIGRVKDHQGLT